jgi:hypothetical protein
MSNDDRIAALASDIYLARHNQKNDATGSDLTDFLDQTIGWVNQLTPEIETAKDAQGRRVNWNFVRTNDDPSIGVINSSTTISYPLPANIRTLVFHARRDLTIQYDGTPVATFKLVSPDQIRDPLDYDPRDRATVLQRKLIFSRPFRDVEVGGTIVADTLAPIPQLSHTDVSLLDLLDQYPSLRQAYVYGVLKNQMLPDIVQGGLTPSFSQKFSEYLTNCIAENNISSEADDADRDDYGYIGGVGF